MSQVAKQATRDQLLRWLENQRKASRYIEDRLREEVGALTDAEAAAQARSLLTLAIPGLPEDLEQNGLVRFQAAMIRIAQLHPEMVEAARQRHRSKK